MSKEIYIVNCYTCQHNGQETCKGCNTLLNGDVEPYENWELREDLSQKDQRIAELEQELAEMTRKYEFSCRPVGGLVDTAINLEKQLAELKEMAIDRPKFKHLEEYWYIENNPYCDNELQVFNGKVMEIICAYDEDWLYEYRFDTSCRYIEEDNIFATEQEALNKLKEIQGNE